MGVYQDEVSLFIIYITFLVIYLAYYFRYGLNTPFSLSLTIVIMLLFCLGVFLTDRVFLLYVFYECSLLPILYIIIR